MPLSDELRYALELARKNLNEIYAWDEVDVIDLLRIIDTLQAENAALREALAALADDAYDNAGWRNIERNECNYCMADVVSAEGEPVDCDHGYGCPVARARALLVNGATRDNK